ncbi:hypothetical protein [Spirosoma pollinicola]|uniref:Uncharacterized protein n=1 Tax=Spirosoma pollinicola TaxID=2057025 RepID=A0A2K8YUD6_9BACT|nr:hypothetical protein [Spirosoma pollinicola]AUD01168.1 hypothetical protein CWM47_04660 [Spirosoma pollinicola]
MRTLLFFLAISLYGSVSFAQSDSSKAVQETPVQQSPVQRQVAIPGVDTPISGGGMTAQTPNNPMPPVQDNKKRKTMPPSDPRAFGVSVPVGKTKRDTL